MKYDYLIVGAGLFGSVFACEMNKLGKKCLVIDKRNHIGGNVFTEELSGINVHKYGPHIFHTDFEDIWNYINQYASFNNFINTPLAKYKNELYNLPFNMNTFSKMWGITTPKEARLLIESEKSVLKIESPKNLEEQAISLVGQTIYKKLIKGYTEKQWGKSCIELPPSIIKRIPIRFEYNNNYFNDFYQGIPIGGYTAIIERLLEGIDVQLNCDYFTNQKEMKSKARRILFTGMIDEFYNYIYGELEYRSLKFETHKLDVENYQGVAVVNYTEREVPFTRIIEHKFFEKTNSDRTVISYEFPDSWTKGKEAYYPINDDRNSELYSKYRELAQREEDFIFGGRLADYSYYDMDDTIKKLMLGSTAGLVITSLVVLIPVLMLLDFFGANITDDYVVDNMDYADQYKTTLNKAIKNGYGYVPLNRILYFYLEDDSLSFYNIYVDNIDKETNKLIEISSVCLLNKYKIYSGCKNIDGSNQVDVEQNKPFVPPIDFSITTITSFFMQQRIVFGTYGVHKAWDFAAPSRTPLYASCDGVVSRVSFPYKENTTDTEGGGGNEIVITCEIDEEVTYKVLYAHLYPNSSKVKKNDLVKAGDVIASVGTTGYSTGNHLHFEVTLEGNYVDGMSLIDFNQ